MKYASRILVSKSGTSSMLLDRTWLTFHREDIKRYVNQNSYAVVMRIKDCSNEDESRHFVQSRSACTL
mgnify:CR=1 FL=1